MYFCEKFTILSRKKRKRPVIEGLEVIDLAAEGKAIAKFDGKIIFVNDHAVPGDVVDVQVTRKKKNYLMGYPLAFHQYSPKRTGPFCQHFGTCGGCKWQNLQYQEQLKYKQKQVEEQFKHIAKLEIEERLPILPSKFTKYYRNKLEFTFTNKRWLSDEEVQSGQEIDNPKGLGLHIPGKFDKVLDLNECYLQPHPSNDIRLEIKKFTEENGYPYFDIRKQEGLLRNLIIRTATTGEFMVILSFFHEDKEKIKGLLEHIIYKFPEVTSLMYVINPKANDTITDLDIKLYHGKEFIIENLDGLEFKIGPKSFFQTNSHQTLELYRKIKEFADLQGHETVYDLYTGTGTIANFLARECRKVIGIEYVPEAIEDAKENSKLNNISNAEFYAGDIKDLLNFEFMAIHSKPDLVVLDPPRAGVHPDVIKHIGMALPERIIYVSCNPATQARDIGMLTGWHKVLKTQPLDMFPHTHHVENIALLEKKDAKD